MSELVDCAYCGGMSTAGTNCINCGGPLRAAVREQTPATFAFWMPISQHAFEDVSPAVADLIRERWLHVNRPNVDEVRQRWV